MKTVNDLIAELQKLKPSVREKPIVILSPNGLYLDPNVKMIPINKDNPFSNVEKIIITI